MEVANFKSMFAFIESTIAKTEDINSLTVKILRNQYVAKIGVNELSPENRQVFSSAVDMALSDYFQANRGNEKEIPTSSVSKGNPRPKSNSQNERPDSDGEMNNKSKVKDIEIDTEGNSVPKAKRKMAKEHGSDNEHVESGDVSFDERTSTAKKKVLKSKTNKIDSSSEEELTVAIKQRKMQLNKITHVDSDESSVEEPMRNGKKQSKSVSDVKKQHKIGTKGVTMKKVSVIVSDDSSSEDEPLSNTASKAKVGEKKISSDGSSSEEPLSNVKKQSIVPKVVNKKKALNNGYSTSEDEPLSSTASKAKVEEKKVNSDQSSSEEPLSNVKKQSIVPKVVNKKKALSNDYSTCSSEDEPLSNAKKPGKAVSKVKNSKGKIVDRDGSSSEEPLCNVKKQSTSEMVSKVMASDDSSSEEPLAKVQRRNKHHEKGRDGDEEFLPTVPASKAKTKVNSSSVSQTKRVKKRPATDSDSDANPKAKRIHTDEKPSSGTKSKRRNLENESDDSLSNELMAAVTRPRKKQRAAADDSNYSAEDSLELRMEVDKSLSEEPLPMSAKEAKGRTEFASGDSSDEDPLPTSKKTTKNDNKIGSDDSSSDEEPLEEVRKRNKKKPKGRSDKENDSKRTKENGKQKHKSFQSSDECSDEEPMPTSKKKIKIDNKIGGDDSSSDEEPLAEVKKRTAKGAPNQNKKKPKEHNDKENGKQKQKEPENEDPAVKKLKRYIRAVGLFVHYGKILENCKSKKKKVEKLLSILEEAGMKGKPTLEKCKKLKVQIERRKEVAELDMSNIISDSGRGRRNVASRYQTVASHPSDDTHQKSSKKTFQRLKGIVDSEESD